MGQWYASDMMHAVYSDDFRTIKFVQLLLRYIKSVRSGSQEAYARITAYALMIGYAAS